MSRLAAPYPPNLNRCSFASRQLIFNQLFAAIGMVSLYAADATSSQPSAVRGWPFYVVWMELMTCIGMLINGSAMIESMRHGWRHMRDAQASHDRNSLFHSLPASTKRLMLLSVLLCPMLAAWWVQQAFIAIQSTPWGVANLDQVQPTYASTLIHMLYGFVAACVFEYQHDRWTHHAARAQTAHKLTTEAQLQLLRSQLDPHMLFNTLSNLYELIDDSPEQARAMLLHLIGFLRSTLEGSRTSQHALDDEFKLASDYLSLMQIRMGDRLHTRLELPDELKAAPVPAMLLQPLIENAIKHGLEHRKQGGELSVVAAQEAGQLVLRVRNSGTNESFGLDAPRQGGFGLRSVQERLNTLCGPGEHVELTHIHDQDVTQVTLRLPLATLGTTQAITA